MANILTNLSNIMIPALIFYIIAYGLVSKVNVYEEFITGAKKGFQIVIDIMPTMVSLMIGVGILRASGFLTMLGDLIGQYTQNLGVPGEIVSLAVIKLFSASAATGLVLDIFKTYGTDSTVGMIASILCSCTETVFYTMSVYFMAAKVTKTRWTLAGALVATLAGVIASVWLGKL
ncbi:MAG: spore maturation protein [Eubacteriales bacterium]